MPDTSSGMNGVAVAGRRAAAGEPGGGPEWGGAVDVTSRDDFHRRLRRTARVIWRGKLIILIALLGLSVPAVFIVQQLRPLYTAEVRIMVEAPEVRDALAERNIRPWLTDAVIETESELIASTVLARRVIDKLGLAADPEFNAQLRQPRALDMFLGSLNPISWLVRSLQPSKDEREPEDEASREAMREVGIVAAFRGKLSVQAQRRSYIIIVRYTAETREKAVLIANTVADTYVLDRLEAGFDEARRVATWLGERLEVLRRDVNVAATAVEDFRSRHNLRRKNERQTTLADQQLSEVNSRLVLSRSDLAQKQARLDQIRQLLRSRGSVDTTTDVLQSQLIQRLREQEATLQRDLSDALKTYGERHPRLVGLRAELGEIRGKIALEVEKIAVSLANEVEVSKAGVQSLERELAGVQQQANVAGGAEIRLHELERHAEANRTLYEAFLNRFKREAEQERMQRANARVVSPAVLPAAPSFPRKAPILSAVVMAGIALGLGLVFLLDRLDNVIRSADEAEELTGLPVLGMVPLQRGGRDRPFEEIIKSPRSALADALRSLRTSADVGEAGGARIVVVTSSIPKEGKTFVSLCLAVMFSKSHGRVLLIDADLHRPRQHTVIGVDGQNGLAQVLSGEAAFDDVVQRGAVDTLDFLPAGHASNVSELVQSPTLNGLLQDLRGRYDRIIIDTSPVLAVSDTRVLARFADRVIYLVRWSATPRDAVRNGMKLLRSAGIEIFGIALSQVNRRKHNRYGYHDYGHYYGRYRDYYGE